MFGQTGAAFISVVVMISTFGSLMGSMLASPRIFFAMADDKLFFQPIAAVHPKFNTPYIAILLACVLGVAMVMTQTFEQLTDTFVLAMWPFYALSVAAIYRLRRSQPHLHRPYKVIGYPVRPRRLRGGRGYLVINALINDPKWTSITFARGAGGIAGVLRGVPQQGRVTAAGVSVPVVSCQFEMGSAFDSLADAFELAARNCQLTPTRRFRTSATGIRRRRRSCR